MKAVLFCLEVHLNPSSSLAGDYTEVFEEKIGAFSVCQQGRSILFDVSVLNGFCYL
ncbi:hypothetical protein ACLB1S_18555 [Escherichia coli]